MRGNSHFLLLSPTQIWDGRLEAAGNRISLPLSPALGIRTYFGGCRCPPPPKYRAKKVKKGPSQLKSIAPAINPRLEYPANLQSFPFSKHFLFRKKIQNLTNSKPTAETSPVSLNLLPSASSRPSCQRFEEASTRKIAACNPKKPHLESDVSLPEDLPRNPCCGIT